MGEGGEERLRQGEWEAGQLAVHGPRLARDLVPLDGIEDGPATAALVAGQRVGENPHQLGEGELVLVAATAVAVEQVVEDRIGGDVPPDGVERLGQRQSVQHLSRKGVRGLHPRRHGRLLNVLSGQDVVAKLRCAQQCAQRTLGKRFRPSLPRSG